MFENWKSTTQRLLTPGGYGRGFIAIWTIISVIGNQPHLIFINLFFGLFTSYYLLVCFHAITMFFEWFFRPKEIKQPNTVVTS